MVQISELKPENPNNFFTIKINDQLEWKEQNWQKSEIPSRQKHASACMVRCSVEKRIWSGLVEGIQPIKCIAKTMLTWSTTCIQQHNHLPTHSSTKMVGLMLFCNGFVVRFVPQTKCFIEEFYKYKTDTKMFYKQ